jgi:hypothetical protein
MKIKILLASLFVSAMLLCSPRAPAQVSVGVEFGRRAPMADVVVVEPPVCQYGYYDYRKNGVKPLPLGMGI